MTELAVEPLLGDDGASVLGLTVSGVLDHDNAEEFLDAFRAALPDLRATGGGVRIDCAGVRSCDYAGLSALLMARREAADDGARLILERQSPQLAALLSVAGVSDLLSRPDAMAAEDGVAGADLGRDFPQEPDREADQQSEHESDQNSDQQPDQVPDHVPDRVSDDDLGDGRAEVTVGRAGKVPVIRVAGQVDLDSVEDITAAFARARADAHGGRIVVDLSRLEFADSTTLHVLLQARAAGELWLVGPLRPQVHLLFQVTDLLEAFHFADGLDQAVGALDRAV